MNKWTADFETNNHVDDCRVWAWAVCRIGDEDEFEYGNDLDSFFYWCSEQRNPILYFHNLKFDIQFILSWLFNHGFTWIESGEEKDDFTFTTMITDTGQFYSMTIYLDCSKKTPKTIKFYDSMKILNFSVLRVAKSFNLPISKLKIDYNEVRPVGHPLTTEEVDYIRNDVKIMAMALDIMFEEGHTKMTIASNAMAFYKHIIGDKAFRDFFPLLDTPIDKDIRSSYKGGFTYLNPAYKGKTTGQGLVFDKNSMYPSVMVQEVLPYGMPIYYDGKYEEDKFYPLYVQRLSCSFKLKPGKIPSIQIKNSLYFLPNQYIETSDDEIITLTLTSVDLELFLENYDVDHLEYINGFKFQGMKGLFDNYINYWTEQKIQAKKDNNSGMYTISKLFLNSLYGKFGLNSRAGRKAPFLDLDGVVRYRRLEDDERETIYVPVAAFITSYARADIIRSSERVREFTLKHYGYDGYVYSDTDSIHCLVKPEDVGELAKFLDIDDYRLGAWKMESVFSRGKYLRQKCYIEEIDDEIISTVAGLPKSLRNLINFDNFKIGFNTAEFSEEEIGENAKLDYRYCKGGVCLVPTDFTIK